MEEIRKGGTLRHVSPEKINKMVPDSRGELIDQIGQHHLGAEAPGVRDNPEHRGDTAEGTAEKERGHGALACARW